MLNENIKTLRKQKGLSQEGLAIKLNVVRQTVSKWESGLSVPDSELLVLLANELDVSVSTLLGENIEEKERNDLKVISEKLEVINLQLLKRNESKKKIILGIFLTILVVTLLTFSLLVNLGSPYLNWNFFDPETAVVGTMFHIFEWIFFRVFLIVIIASIIGIILTLKHFHSK